MSGADDQPQPQFAHRTGALGAGNDLDSGTYTVADFLETVWRDGVVSDLNF
jgi:hypothetical protein